ncbi:MAG: hypothetical protein QM754_09355 [Tepidisphaeraceae bacterium]
MTLLANTYRDEAEDFMAATALTFFLLVGDADHNATVNFNGFRILQPNFGVSV